MTPAPISCSSPTRTTWRVLQQGLRDRGVLVRRFERPRIQDHLRVSIGTDEEMEAMCRAMEEILKGQ